MKILDWYNHQGHQYEFSKIDIPIYLVGLDNKKPSWDENHRPLRSNVVLCDIKKGIESSPDIVMWRRGSDFNWCKRMAKEGAVCIGVAQTTYFDYMVPNFVKILVWNSKSAMEKLYKNYPWCKHVYIPHGFDHNEFENMNIERKNKAVSVFSLFEERGKILGYDNWLKVCSKVGCDLWGHGNEKTLNSVGHSKSFKHLVEIYNSYKVYLNTSVESAMPRSRAEAMMCGTPAVTTSYYDISEYITHGINGFLADNHYDMIKYCNLIINDYEIFKNLSFASRELAKDRFSIQRYIKSWKSLF